MIISSVFVWILSVLVCYFMTFFTVRCLFKSYQTNDVANKLKSSLVLKLKEIDLHSDLNSLLDKHLTEFISTLKQQIPMAGMFLTSTLTEKLKGQAKEEFMKMLPELKEKIWQRFSHDLSFMENMIRESIAKRMFKVSLYGALVGFFLGSIQFLIILFFSK